MDPLPSAVAGHRYGILAGRQRGGYAAGRRCPLRSARCAQAKARYLEPGELTRGPVRARLPQLGLRCRQDQAEEHVPQALLYETSVGCLSRDRNPNLLTGRGDVKTNVDQPAERDSNIVA
jgi:hypothetical protein